MWQEKQGCVIPSEDLFSYWYDTSVSEKPIFVYCFNHQLGSIQRDLSQLQAEKLLLRSADTLSAIGYRYNFGVARN